MRPLRFLSALVPLVLATSAFAQSDTCVAATVLPANSTVTGNNISATSDLLSAPCSIFEDPFDVWYRFSPTSTATYTFDVFGIDDVDPTLTIFGACTTTLIACNDDFSDVDFNPQIILNLAAGQTVYCRVSLNFEDRGSFTIRASGSPSATPPANDDCTAANLPALVVGVPATGTTDGANTSISLNPDGCGSFVGSGGGGDVFFRFTPAATGDYAIDSCGSSFDTILSIHAGCPVTDANLLACNDDTFPECDPTGTNSRIAAVSLTGGQTYYVRLAGYFEVIPDFGTYSVRVSALSGSPTGACCRGGTCSATTADACSGFASRWVGASTVCNVPGNTTTPCCRADYNQVGGITVQDIFDFLGDYFDASFRADVNGVGGVNVQDIFDFLGSYFAGAC